MASKELIGGVRQGTAKPVNRRRISVWTSPPNVLARGKKTTVNPAFTRLGGVLDDVSLLITFYNSVKMDDVDWDANFLPGGSDPLERETWLADVKKALAAVNIQVLAGYGLQRDPNQPASKTASFNALNAWLNASIDGKETPTMDAYVTILKNFFQSRCKGYDGISFDIEGLAPSRPHTVAQMATAVSTFYGKVADAIFPLVVGVATGALVAPTSAFNNYENGGPPTPPSSALPAIVGARLHPYEMAVNHPNLIVRPMMYDGQPRFSKNKKAPQENHEGMMQWQRDMCVYALAACNGGKGISNASFQVGIKTSSQGGTGLGGVTTEDKILAHATECRTHKSRRTATLPAGKDPDIPDDVGIIFFPGLSGVTTVNKVDAAINPTGPAAGIVGTPIQVPRIV